MRFLIVIATVLMYACTTSTAGDTKEKSYHPANSSGKILLELFTSQGCSSCPPADQLVSSLAQADTNLIVISFHVDYWDRLGWKDMFSNHDYTVRQQQYVQALHVQSSYTPQAVVQGQFEMVGSNQKGILNAVKTAGAQSGDVDFNVKASVNDRSISVAYQLGKAVSSGYQVNAVLVQNQSSTSIASGENSGRQLLGYHVARSMKSMVLAQTGGDIQLILPDDLKPDNASVVVFIQHISSKKIVAVKQIGL